MTTPIPFYEDGLLAPIAVALLEELQDFRENHEYEKNKCQTAIAKGNFVDASRNMHESMIWEYNNIFANCFIFENFDNIMGSLFINLLSSPSNPRAHELALMDSLKEQYKFCLRAQKMIARRASR